MTEKFRPEDKVTVTISVLEANRKRVELTVGSQVFCIAHVPNDNAVRLVEIYKRFGAGIHPGGKIVVIDETVGR